MNPKVFETLYLTNEESLRNVLMSQKIFDEDIFQDTCLALCEFAQHSEITDFWTLFMEKYNNLYKRIGQREVECVHLDNAQLAALDIIDESQDVAILDRDIDWFNDQRRVENKERLHKLLNYYYRHPLPGERDHRRACRILRLYLKGLSFREIANTMRLDVATVYKYFSRTVERLKANTLCIIIEGHPSVSLPSPLRFRSV